MVRKDEIRLFNRGTIPSHDVAIQTEGFQNTSLLERLKARIAESAIKVSTVKAPHTYMKAVGTMELEKILEEEFNHG